MFGFIKNPDEACVYKKVSGSAVAFLVLYVDDILLIGNNVPFLNKVKDYLKSKFSMKDLDEAAYILGIKIYRDRTRSLIGLSQDTYLEKVVKVSYGEFQEESKAQRPKTDEERQYMSEVPFALEIGSIMYAMICTHPDVSFALIATSRHQSDPGKKHWFAVKRILKHLRRTKDLFLVYGGDKELVIKGYTDASFVTDPDDSKSQSGYVFTLNGGAFSWKSLKQGPIAESTTKAKYIAASEATKEGVWIKKFMIELGVVLSVQGPMEIYCDNNGAIAQAREPRSHQKNKHVLRKYHLIREYVDEGEIKLYKIHTDLNVEDPLTKPLSLAKHVQHREAIDVRHICKLDN
jgi:hypothetical protein